MTMTMKTLETPCFLVAMPQLMDRNFVKAVLLLIEHSSDGAIAFVINRPLVKPLKEFLGEGEFAPISAIPAWQGGPVGTSSGLVLHNQTGDEAHRIHEGIFLSSSPPALKGLCAYAEAYELESPQEKAIFGHERLNSYDCLYPFRFLVGHAGWAPRQLDEEVRQGAWMQLPYDRDLLFNTTWHQMWNAAMDLVGVNPMEIAPVSQNYLN